MLKKRKLLLTAFFPLLFFTNIFARQNLVNPIQDSSIPLRIAVLLPLYIDSAFDDLTYKLKPNYIPQYILGGLDFYNGIMMAVDSLQKENLDIEVYVYDTKKINEPADSLVNEMKPLNFSLIIAAFTNSDEQKVLSGFSFDHNIPLISATYPNDGGIAANPFFIMLNSTLKTHVEGIYKYASKNYAANKILYVTRQGPIEDKIKNYFISSAIKNHTLKYGEVVLADNFLPENILPFLDSTLQNVIICGSLNQSFAVNLIQTITTAKSYNVIIIGMPDWDGIKELNETLNSSVQIVYSTPYRFYRDDSIGIALTAAYKSKFFARPSDMVFKGFEDLYHFTHLLKLYDTNFINHLSDTAFTIANIFNIQPVKRTVPGADTDSTSSPDFFENKTLYFIKKINDKIISVTPLQ